MIVPNQSNLKVHFAGAEQTDFAYCISNGANIKYLLFSVYYFIDYCLGFKNGGFWKGKPIYEEFELFETKHSIMDSGLFTLMFGCNAGKRSEKDIEIWYNNLIEFVIKNKVSSTCVEIDCQKILGVKKAWELRKRMKTDLPNNRQINVFHKEDGQQGLDEMIEFSDYIAISVPELRFMGQKNDTIKIAHYIKNKKPNIDIHLLGCTELKILSQLSFCSSSDSTTWQQINRYGNIGKFKVKNINQNIVNNKYQKTVVEMSNRYNREITAQRIDYYSRYILAAEFYKNRYTLMAGNQN